MSGNEETLTSTSVQTISLYSPREDDQGILFRWMAPTAGDIRDPLLWCEAVKNTEVTVIIKGDQDTYHNFGIQPGYNENPVKLPVSRGDRVEIRGAAINVWLTFQFEV